MLPSRRLLAIVCCVGVAMAAIVGLVVVHRFALMRRSGQRLEEYARWAVGADAPVASFLTVVSSGPAVVLYMVLALAWAAWSVRVRGWQVLIGCVVCVLGANVTTQVLKLVVDRPDWGFGPHNTWPSGHMTATMTAAVVAMWATPRRWRPLMAVPTVALSLLVGMAVVLLRWHRVSDVVGAVLVCLTWTALCAAAFRLRPILHRRLAYAHKVAAQRGARWPQVRDVVKAPRQAPDRARDHVSIRTLVGVVAIALTCVMVAGVTTALLFAAGVRGIPGRAAHELGRYSLWACALAIGGGMGLASLVLPVGQLLRPRWGIPAGDVVPGDTTDAPEPPDGPLPRAIPVPAPSGEATASAEQTTQRSL